MRRRVIAEALPACASSVGSIPQAKESEEQEALFEWAAIEAGAKRELELLYHIPNEGKRSGRAGAALLRQGLKRGVPDICLPVARGGYHALYIELKRRSGGKRAKAKGSGSGDFRRQATKP